MRFPPAPRPVPPLKGRAGPPLPGLLRAKLAAWTAVGFGAGVALMLAVRWLDKGGGPGNEEEQEQRASEKKAEEGAWPVGLLAGAAMDQVVSGLLLGIGVAAGQKVGVLLSLGWGPARRC